MWSRSESSGQTQLKRVVQTFERFAVTLKLTFSTGETIETTREHPFFVEHKGFLPAGELGIGTSIVTRAGPSVKLVSTSVGHAQKVFNFEVEDFHSYFVGNTEVWVHNQCGVRFSPGFWQHLTQGHGINANGVLSGGHNLNHFDNLYRSRLNIFAEYSHPTIPGLKKIGYYDNAGNAQWKTLYDPAIISDSTMASWILEVRQNAVGLGTINGNTWTGTTANGLSIQGYTNAGVVVTGFPVF